MKKSIFLCLLLVIMTWTFKVHAQAFTTSLDSLVATFQIKNKKAVQVQPNTVSAKTIAQKNTADLLFILDNFFATNKYEKAKTINATQYLLNTAIKKEDIVADSFLAVVYILEMPDTNFCNEQLRTGEFLKVKSRPAKAPEKTYISALDKRRLIIVAFYSPLYKDAAAAARRQEHVNTCLDWIRQKYR